MKPQYDPYIKRWSVEGKGYYNTLAEAKAAVKRDGQSERLVIRLKPDLKVRLQNLAEAEGISVSEWIRRKIEEVQENG